MYISLSPNAQINKTQRLLKIKSANALNSPCRLISTSIQGNSPSFSNMTNALPTSTSSQSLSLKLSASHLHLHSLSALNFPINDLIMLYKAKCKDLDIIYTNKQATRFINYCNLSFTNKTINLQSSGLRINSSKILSKLLPSTKSFCKLNLSNNRISDKGALLIVKALCENSSFIHLDLSNNDITPDGSALIFEALLENEGLISINLGSVEGLCRNRVGCKGGQALGALLVKNDVLTMLDVASTYIGIEGTQLISLGLRHNRSLLVLNLANNEIGCKGVHNLCVAIAHTRVCELVLSGNPVHDKACSYIKDLLMFKYGNCCIKKLLLSKCQITEEGGAKLFFGLENNATLEVLELSFNSLGNCGFLQSHNALTQNTTLKSLNLSGCSLKDEAISYLSEGISQNISIERLFLANNSLSSISIRSLSSLIQKNKSLKHLDLSQNLIKTSEGLTLTSSLRKNRTLISINLSENSLKDEIGPDLIDLTRYSPSLFKIDLSLNPINLKYIDQITKNLAKNFLRFKKTQFPRLQEHVEKLVISDEEILQIFTKIAEKEKEKKEIKVKIVKQRTKFGDLKFEELEKMEVIKNEHADVVNAKKNAVRGIDIILAEISKVKHNGESIIRELKDKGIRLNFEIKGLERKSKFYIEMALKNEVFEKKAHVEEMAKEIVLKLNEEKEKFKKAEEAFLMSKFKRNHLEFEISKFKTSPWQSPVIEIPKKLSKKKTIKKKKKPSV